MARNSILDYYLESGERYGDRTAALAKREGAYREVTWREMVDQSRRISAALIELGVQPGDRVVLLSKSSVEWVVADMGIVGAGAVTVPIYQSNLPEECEYIVGDSGAVVALVEDAGQSEKFRAVRERMPDLRHVVQMAGAVVDDDGWVLGWDDFLGRGHVDDAVLEERRRRLDKDSIYTIIYTSGTTGKPKGAVLTHDAMLYEAEAIQQIDIVRDDDVQFFWLPLAHSFARVLEIGWLSVRHVMAFAESMDTIRENLGETRPTLMAGVPRVYEKFHAAVVQKGSAGGGLKPRLFAAAVDLSQKNGEAEARGASLGLRDALQFKLLQKLVFAKVGQGLEEILGGRMRHMISGGAPLSPKIAWFFRDAGVTILEGWGLTETSAATCVNRPGKNKIGTVGPPMPGTDLRIAEDGEILVRGRGVMREYWQNPAATAETLRDGWFYTGDIGSIDRDGSLRITDRKKDIIVTAGGKNVAPQNIENMLKTHRLISQVVVHGDKRKFLTAVITIDADAVKGFAAEHGLPEGSPAELSQHPEVQKAVQAAVAELNQQLASYETIKKFKILEHDFTQEAGELTPSLKVKRKVVNEHYKAVFDAFYEERY